MQRKRLAYDGHRILMRKLPALISGALQPVGAIHVKRRGWTSERPKEPVRKRISQPLA